jgi:serine/threonine protein kinase
MALLDSTWHPTLNIPIDKYTLYSPLATSNFHSLITSAASLKTRTRLFAQVLEGLAFLHSQRIAHRDIKPGNLAVITFDPPVAQILDFGCAAFIPAFFSSSDSSEASASAPSPEASSLPPGTCPSARGRGKLPYANEGTIPYLAPEQVPGRYHNESVDLWAAALVGLEILRYRLRGRVLEAEYGRIHEWLDDYERIPRRTGLASAVRGMLRWGPEERGCALGVGEMWFADLDMRDVEGVNGDGKRGGGDTVHEREGGLKKNSFSEMALKDMG